MNDETMRKSGTRASAKRQAAEQTARARFPCRASRTIDDERRQAFGLIMSLNMLDAFDFTGAQFVTSWTQLTRPS